MVVFAEWFAAFASKSCAACPSPALPVYEYSCTCLTSLAGSVLDLRQTSGFLITLYGHGQASSLAQV
jgi:hypothetical protein